MSLKREVSDVLKEHADTDRKEAQEAIDSLRDVKEEIKRTRREIDQLKRESRAKR